MKKGNNTILFILHNNEDMSGKGIQKGLYFHLKIPPKL